MAEDESDRYVLRYTFSILLKILKKIMKTVSSDYGLTGRNWTTIRGGGEMLITEESGVTPCLQNCDIVVHFPSSVFANKVTQPDTGETLSC